MWVVKLGGSLAASPRLGDWLDALAVPPNKRVVIVPGGGPFADAVRQSQNRWGYSEATAHHMALLGMAQYGLMLTGLHAGLSAAASITAMRAAWRAGKTPVWLPVPMALQDPAIEASWRVTSDSLALWLTQRLNAGRLALIKSVEPPVKADIGALMAGGIVDEAFGDFARRCDCELLLFGPNDCAVLARAVHTDSRAGVSIARS